MKYSAISLIHFRSPIIHQFKPENSVDLVQIGVSNQSLSKGGVKINCHKHFNMQYGYHPRQISCTPLTTILITRRKVKLNGKSYNMSFFIFPGTLTVYSVSTR